MDNKTNAGTNRPEQTVDAKGVADAVERRQSEQGVQAKENYNLDNTEIEVNNG